MGKYFLQYHMLTKGLGRENLQIFFRVAPESICGPLLWDGSNALKRNDPAFSRTVPPDICPAPC